VTAAALVRLNLPPRLPRVESARAAVPIIEPAPSIPVTTWVHRVVLALICPVPFGIAFATEKARRVGPTNVVLPLTEPTVDSARLEEPIATAFAPTAPATAKAIVDEPINLPLADEDDAVVVHRLVEPMIRPEPLTKPVVVKFTEDELVRVVLPLVAPEVANARLDEPVNGATAVKSTQRREAPSPGHSVLNRFEMYDPVGAVLPSIIKENALPWRQPGLDIISCRIAVTFRF